jgi:cell wall-associated NlpC family hydrolase
MTHWSEPFVGIPWVPTGRDLKGCDCYGLVRLVYRNILLIELDPLDGCYSTAEEREDIAAIIVGARDNGPWRPVEIGQESDFDVLVFHWLGFQSHVGLVAGRGLMLHAMADQPSGIVRYAEGRWRPRLAGIYRHRMRA